MKALELIPPICCGSDAPPMDRDDAESVATIFKALGDPTRVAIVNRLSGAGSACVCDLTAAFELTQPTVSHHLRILRQAGLVEAEGLLELVHAPLASDEDLKDADANRVCESLEELRFERLELPTEWRLLHVLSCIC